MIYPQYQQQYNYPQYPQMYPQQMQSGGFVSVRNEMEARNYPVAPGNVMTFKIENQPYVCEKSQGFSQLEGPRFEKYRLVKEEDIETPTTNTEEKALPIPDYTNDIEELRQEIEEIKKRLDSKVRTASRRLVKEEEDE